MRVLLIIQRLQLRGAEVFACQLATELQRRGIFVDIVYLFGGEPSDWPFRNLRLIPLNARERNRIWDFGGFRRLAGIIRAGKYDVIQANAGDTLKYSVLSRMIFKYPGTLIYRNANKMSDFIHGRLHQKFIRWLLKSCDLYVSVSENCRQDLIGITAGAATRSTTIPIGTYLHDDIETLSISRSGPVLINVGTMVPEKNHLFLLEIFNRYLGRGHQAQLWIVGGGPLWSEISQRIESLNLTGRVRLWGYRRDVISVLKAADVMVMPSRIEGLPGVILEAMACGVPVIASAVGGIPEVIEHDRSGYCVHGSDRDEYVGYIEECILNHQKRRQITAAARKLIEEKFMMPTIAGRFIELYYSALDKEREENQ